MAQQSALIRFYFNRDMRKLNVEQCAKMMCETTYLVSIGANGIKFKE